MKLSIIIPVYNTPVSFLKECIESIQKSNIKTKYEVIIINDGSQEQDVLDFLNSYSTPPNMQILNKINKGVSAARNIGLKLAQGEYILCLDSDDILLPEINNAIEYMEKNNQYDVLYCDVPCFGSVNYTLKKYSYSKFRNIYIRMQPPITSIFRRKILNTVGYFKESMNMGEDWDFWARMSSQNVSFKHYPFAFFKYRKIFDGKSLSQKGATQNEKVATMVKSQFNPHQEITLEEINKYVLNNFKDNKKHLIKLFLIIFFPILFKLLQKKGIYKNNIVVD